MTEPIVLDLNQAAALLWHQAHNRRWVSKCATCDGKRVLAVDREAGFCGDCLERSRILDGDDLGGES
jgi:hypothetical protein